MLEFRPISPDLPQRKSAVFRTQPADYTRWGGNPIHVDEIENLSKENHKLKTTSRVLSETALWRLRLLPAQTVRGGC